MVLVDSSILGTFGCVRQLQLLIDLFGADALGLTPAVLGELQSGVDRGLTFLRDVVDSVTAGKLLLVTPTIEETLAKAFLPTSLDAGERESIAVCQARGFPFLTNDRRARNFCLDEGMIVYDLPDLFRALWMQGICSKKQVRVLLGNIETKERLVIKNKERIFRG